MKMFRVIIIDDERIAREEVKRALAEHAGFDIVAEAKNIIEAKQQIESLNPDLIFLDIEMPGGSGFDLLESLNTVPYVVFTTAFNEYAVQAFEVDALDYLVKPMRAERFTRTIERVRSKLNGKEQPKQLFIKDGNRCHLIKLEDIYLVESLDNYARIYYADKSACIKRSLNQLEELMDADVFFRISRTHIININYIRQIHPLPKGKLSVSMQKGEMLDVSVRQSVKFKSLRKW